MTALWFSLGIVMLVLDKVLQHLVHDVCSYTVDQVGGFWNQKRHVYIN